MTATALDASQSRDRGARSRKPFYAKLKPGPGCSREEVVASQRSRLHGAMIELSAERGYESVTVRSLSRLAGVSTRSFYKHFANAEECFASTYESLMQEGLRRAYAVQSESEDPERRLRASLQTLIEDLAANPKAARLVLIEAFALGPAMQMRMRGAIAGFERLLSDSLGASRRAPAPPRHLLGGIAAGVMRVARTRLLAGEAADPEALARELGDWILSFPGEYPSAPETAESEPFRLFAPRNGNELREDPGPAVLGEVGDEEGRILSAAAKLALVDGFSNLTIPRVRAEAGVSRRSFDARFADVGECFLAAIEAIVLTAATRAESDAGGAGSWESEVGREIEVLCTEAAASPLLARLAFVGIFEPGRAGLARRERLISLAVDRLREAAPPERRPTELVAEASVAAAWRIAHAEIVSGRVRELPRLAPLLSYVTVVPAVGAAAAF